MTTTHYFIPTLLFPIKPKAKKDISGSVELTDLQIVHKFTEKVYYP